MYFNLQNKNNKFSSVKKVVQVNEKLTEPIGVSFHPSVKVCIPILVITVFLCIDISRGSASTSEVRILKKLILVPT